jgi:hydrogenase expression/formation protein HypD
VKHLDEYRDKELVQKLINQIGNDLTRPWTLMEICGGQTHSIMKYGLLDLLPKEITMVHGPGCPVCVTPVELIDKAIALSMRDETILTSFGDMLRVPGSENDLLGARAAGGDVRIVYSPLDAVRLAAGNPGKQVVLSQAEAREIMNFSVLTAHVLVPPAMKALLSNPDIRIDGFLAAGHVCTVMGYEEYIPISEEYQIPIAVTGFEPVDILLGIQKTVEMLEKGMVGVENAYPRAVKKEGNIKARELLNQVFESGNRTWRGIGNIPQSGYHLRERYKRFDAGTMPGIEGIQASESEYCIAGQILTGISKPNECSAFATLCTPEKPLGAPMVSSEGACAAYYRYNRVN